MSDRQFSDVLLASLYDLFHPRADRDDLAFYMPMVMSAGSVLDAGCGTGALLKLAREHGHKGRLCGLDPAHGMLEQARTRRDVQWVQGDLDSVRWNDEFDLVVMTGHAFQVLLEDEVVRASLATVRNCLKEDGLFAFETRNPLAQAWESWTPETQYEVIDNSGSVIRMTNAVELPVHGDMVSFTTTFTSSTWERPQVSWSTLRFLDPQELGSFLFDAGFDVDEQFGEWDRRPLSDVTTEIITIARRA